LTRRFSAAIITQPNGRFWQRQRRPVPRPMIRDPEPCAAFLDTLRRFVTERPKAGPSPSWRAQAA